MAAGTGARAELGCETLAICPRISHLWGASAVGPAVDRLLAALQAEAGDEEAEESDEGKAGRPPLLLHLFSAAPSMFLPHLTGCLAAGGRFERTAARLCGLVFDSCPVDVTRQAGQILTPCTTIAFHCLFLPVTASPIPELNLHGCVGSSSTRARLT